MAQQRVKASTAGRRPPAGALEPHEARVPGLVNVLLLVLLE
jgi:hypothetical protein